MSTVHLHYVKSHPASLKTSERARLSFEENGWDVNMVAGYTSTDAPADELFLLEYGRTYDIIQGEIQAPPAVVNRKLAILCNHIRFWNMVADSNQVQIYAEDDGVCCTKVFELPPFDDVLCLSMSNDNIYWQGRFGKKDDDVVSYQLESKPHGAHNLPYDFPWTYEYYTLYNGALMMPGADCYALSPQGARKLLDCVELHGAEQGDMMINTKTVDIKYCVPNVVHFPQEPLTDSMAEEY